MKYFLTSLLLLFVQLTSSQNNEVNQETIDFKGFFNFKYQENNDKIYLEVSNINQEFLYINSLAAGVGSNDIGLDRGQLGKTAVVKFIKAGNKLLLIEPNQKYRAVTNNIEEKKSVEEAFAQSVLYGFPIVKRYGSSYTIDISSFLLRDAHGVATRLAQKKQGNYNLDISKSAIYLDNTKSFPKNSEFEVLLTFTGNPKGNYIKSVAPNPQFVTVRQHHSFIKLPDSNFKMRKFDPRAGVNSISFYDYATPITTPLVKKFIVKHRLEKKNPQAKTSEAKEPIIYYLDRGVPEPVKTALLEGGRWWNQAFEAIGYKNAFQVKMLPENAHPLDIRYNVIQWVHRSTRGWSYGASVVDPRTGEILKGHVSLGSLRIRQDYLIAQALLGASELNIEKNTRLQMALARIRQLSAHEIGHTLGFTHNFAASYSNRASVMDYPHPYIGLKENKIDLSDAYAVGIGEWDKVSVAYAYKNFESDKNEEFELNKIIDEALKKGLKFISDRDARAPGGAHAYAHLWDNGIDAGEELRRILKVRKTAITNFSENNISKNEPLSNLEEVFVPLYFLHRYQVEAASKLIGGLEYTYAVKGDGQTIVKPVPVSMENEALHSLLQSLSVENLKIPKRLTELFPPKAFGYARTRESFKSNNGLTFDALGAASTAADFVVKLLFHPERASRMIQQKALYPKQLGLDELIDFVIGKSFKISHNNAYDFEIQQSINNTVLEALLQLAANNKATFQAKALTLGKINALNTWLKSSDGKKNTKHYNLGYIKKITDFLKQPIQIKSLSIPKIPDGAPIGSFQCNFEY